jgi:hypothetical protein
MSMDDLDAEIARILAECVAGTKQRRARGFKNGLTHGACHGRLTIV